MASSRTPRRLPSDVARHLTRLDRVLATASLRAGGWAVATASHLAVLGDEGLRWRRPWHEVDHGSWDETGPLVRIRWVDGGESLLALAEASGRSFPEAFRERVQSSIVHVERLELRAGVTVRAVVRRDGAGGLLSQVIADGTGRPTPHDAPAILDLEARARRAVGLSG